MPGLVPCIEVRVNGVGYLSDERFLSYLELAGLGSTALIRTFDLRYDLISALVEQWHPKTHTFHLSCRECTITLQDVALQLGLLIDGNAVTGVSSISKSAALCYNLLRRSLSEGNFTAQYHRSIQILPAHIHRNTRLFPTHIYRSTPLLPAQVHQWRLRHMIFHLCFTHPYVQMIADDLLDSYATLCLGQTLKVIGGTSHVDRSGRAGN
ncbi:hypothetical protein PVK06_027702 [Gossypium arboreum]|uniref:Aminotransferase-like plant mobile domain-containing protein n=1 Tax=Gossypium arboreum TaxID=29729 RepID=A0ABR0P293_GOSAR|nr:hypothetical protein PVK06_027702 [Gossypium arboreum]